MARLKKRGPLGPLKHLEKEARECQKEPWNLTEKADCLFMLCESVWRSGRTLEDLLDAAFVKLEVNKQRAWPKPTSSDEPVEHQR